MGFDDSSPAPEKSATRVRRQRAATRGTTTRRGPEDVWNIEMEFDEEEG